MLHSLSLLAAVLILSTVTGCQAPVFAPRPVEEPAPPGRSLVTHPPIVQPQVLVEGLALPVSLHFAPDRRLFFVEVNKGQVRVMEQGVLQPTPWVALEVAGGSEQGLVGLTLDPKFSQNGYVYLYYTVPKKSGKADFNRVVRYTDRHNAGTDPQIILDNIPPDVKGAHNGGRMLFGPDGKLYVGTGNPGDENTRAQDLSALEGKILRLNSDGSVPADNPFPGSLVFALGLRNPFGMAFHPHTGRLYAVDNGPKGFDELNLIRARGNYGSPLVSGAAGDPRFIDPIWHSETVRFGLSGLVFYTGSSLAEYKDDLFFCLWNPGILRRVRLGGPELDQIEQQEDLAVDCRLDVANGPDGALYVASINRILRLQR